MARPKNTKTSEDRKVSAKPAEKVVTPEKVADPAAETPIDDDRDPVSDAGDVGSEPPAVLPAADDGVDTDEPSSVHVAPAAVSFDSFTPSTSVRYLTKVMRTYFGVGGYTVDIANRIVTALNAGKQPVIVHGKDNVKFAVEVSDVPFVAGNASADRTHASDNTPVVVNVARLLADARLYPLS